MDHGDLQSIKILLELEILSSLKYSSFYVRRIIQYLENYTVKYFYLYHLKEMYLYMY